MGDRGNIVIEKDGDWFTSDVYFYTHWRGSTLEETLRIALNRGKRRWEDPSYLARIIFCAMLSTSDLDEETGFGISTVIGDNEHDLLCVHIPSKQVTLRKPNKTRDEIKSWSFEEFIQDKTHKEARQS